MKRLMRRLLGRRKVGSVVVVINMDADAIREAVERAALTHQREDPERPGGDA